MVEGILAFNWPGLVLSVPTWLPGGIQFDKLSWISLQVISFQVQPEGCVQIHMLFGKGSLVWCAKGLPKTTTHALFWGSRDCLNLFLFATKRQSWKHFLAPSCMLLGSTIIKVVRPSTVLSQVIVPYTVYRIPFLSVFWSGASLWSILVWRPLSLLYVAAPWLLDISNVWL